MRTVQTSKSPHILTSGRSRTPQDTRTALCPRDRSRRTSAAVARPRFTRKFACFSEKQASPSRSPFIPARSSSSLAFPTPSGGFRNADPKVLSPHGWLARRFSLNCRIPSNTASLVPAEKRNPARTTIPWTGYFASRYPNRISRASILWSSPSAPTTSTHSTSSPMLRPYAPAFIDSAPPTVPGIPESGSIPESPDRAQSTASRGSIAPASTTTDPLERNTTLERCFFVHRTVAPTPLSATRRLDPAPRTCTGRPERPSATTTSRTCPADRGNTSRSAGPPIPMVVYSRRFTWNATSMFRTTVPASLPLPPLPREKAFAQFPDIAGPHRQKDVPRPQGGANRLPRSGGFTQIPGLPMSVLPDRDAKRFAGGALDRLLPGGVHVEDEQNVRVLERR